jgi:hypothetical protein
MSFSADAGKRRQHRRTAQRRSDNESVCRAASVLSALCARATYRNEVVLPARRGPCSTKSSPFATSFEDDGHASDENDHDPSFVTIDASEIPATCLPDQSLRSSL